MSQLEQVAAGALIRARPWDLTGVGLAAPMVLWGFLGWFGTVGDSAGGQPGFFSAAMLAGAGALIVLGGMIAKPDSTTIQAGSVLGLLTALGQAGALVIGWLRGSEKSLKAANVRAAQAQQAAADQAALYGVGPYGATPYGATPYGAGQYVAGQYGPSYQPYRSYPAPPAPRYPAAQYPPGGPAQSGQYPGWSTSPPAQQYPAAPYGPGQGASWPQATGQYPYPASQSGTGPEQYPDPYGKNGSPPPSR
jgi:hypothetical protein